VATPALDKWIVPATVGILIALFSIQFRGTASSEKCSGLHGAVVTVLAVCRRMSIAQTPAVLASLDPRHALGFAWQHPLSLLRARRGFLAITGAEALYADMGHFGAKPIRLGLVRHGLFPALMINYIGQARSFCAIRRRSRIRSICSRPELLFPLVVLRTQRP